MRNGAGLLVATAAALGLALACSRAPEPPAGCTSTEMILASDFDQTCARDSDCSPVGEGSVCFPCLFVCAAGGAINVGAVAQFNAVVSASPAGPGIKNAVCMCPADFAPACCVAGQCQGHMGPCSDNAGD